MGYRKKIINIDINTSLKRHNLSIKEEETSKLVYIFHKHSLIMTIKRIDSNIQAILLVLLNIKPMYYGIKNKDIIYINPIIKKLGFNIVNVEVNIEENSLVRIAIFDKHNCKFNGKDIKRFLSDIPSYHKELGQALGFPQIAIDDYCEFDKDKNNYAIIDYFGFVFITKKENYSKCIEELKSTYKIPKVVGMY